MTRSSAQDTLGARYYSPTLGRFMTPDPLGGHLEDPQSLNRYAYVGNNPVSLTDPTGLDWYLRCGQDSSTCHNGYVGSWNGQNDFTRTIVTSDSIRAGVNSATVNQGGVEITTGGKMYSGAYFDNPASHTTDARGHDVNNSPIDLKGSGELSGFNFHFNDNCGGRCLTSGISIQSILESPLYKLTPTSPGLPIYPEFTVPH